jgi:hypothetical protein
VLNNVSIQNVMVKEHVRCFTTEKTSAEHAVMCREGSKILTSIYNANPTELKMQKVVHVKSKLGCYWKL